MPTIAYNSHGSNLVLNGERFDQITTVVIDHAARRVRGMAISSSSEAQEKLRALRAGDELSLLLTTLQRTEYEGRASIVMYRVRARVNHALTISFAFNLLS